MIPTTIDAMQKDDEYLEKFAELERRLNEPLPVPSKQVEITNLPESPENSGDNDEGNGDLPGDEDSKDNDQDYEVEERPSPIRTRPVKTVKSYFWGVFHRCANFTPAISFQIT